MSEQLGLDGKARPVFPNEPIRGGIDANQPYALSPHAKRPSQNPLVRFYGPGPEGATCKGCTHLYAKQYAGRYLKCDLRGDTNGPGTDHRAGWRACARYEEPSE